jgi:branched-chain amino acid transport system ATP-binding protein
MTLLQATDLSKNFGGVKALDGVDLTLPSAGIHAVIGPNGAGKSTLVNLISGRRQPDRGSILFDGVEIAHWPAHRRIQMGIGYTFQITSIFGEFSCRQNIEIAAQRVGGNADAVDDVLSRLDLTPYSNASAGTLAYGHQRLLEIGMGLAQSPKLLILDEPTQGLSDGEIAVFSDIVRDIASERMVLLIEHNMSVVMSLADRITVLNFGQLLAEGTPDTIRADEQVQRAYLGTGGHDAVAG